MAAPSARSNSVLLVEDDHATRQEIQDLLVSAGFMVINAQDGRQALSYLIATDASSQPAAVVLDLSLPLMSGWELLAIMKCYARLARMPVILVSGQPVQSDLIKHGAVAGFLKKPFHPDELLRLLEKSTDSESRVA